jgi:NTP pyrophosphatase (non-canonical NTP hydrolase)
MIDLSKYTEFVGSVTSKPSSDPIEFINKIAELSNSALPVNPSLLLTAAIGMAAECGEFAELPKKIIFQGKPYNEESHFHMKRELGDIIFYWINACRALNLDPNDVIAENVRKLESRYPGGVFDPHKSENRTAGDL